MRAAYALVALSLCACGSKTVEPLPKAPDDKPQQKAKRDVVPEIKGEIGALDAKAVTQTFEGAMKQVEACQDDRRKKNDKLDFLSGEIAIEVRVTEAGTAREVMLTKSTIGDRVVEKCIVSTLKAASWPKPQGGREGIAKNGFTLPMKADREAVPWEAGKVAGELGKAKAALKACTKGKSSEVTLYVDARGLVISAGAPNPTDGSEGVADCVASEVSKLKFPSPGGWPAKVTVPIE